MPTGGSQCRSGSAPASGPSSRRRWAAPSSRQRSSTATTSRWRRSCRRSSPPSSRTPSSARFEGFTPLFGYLARFQLHNPFELLWFALIGVVCGFMGLLYAKGFYGLQALFERLPVTRYLRPALGGLAVGAMALFLPQVLGTGYGWVQESLGRQSLLHLSLAVVLLLPFAKILATGFSIGSGGSGGSFRSGHRDRRLRRRLDVATARALRSRDSARSRGFRGRGDDGVLRVDFARHRSASC